jgi:hypothetical protein
MSKRTTKKRPAARPPTINWFQWRKTTNDLINLLDRRLRKLEETIENARAGLSRLEGDKEPGGEPMVHLGDFQMSKAELDHFVIAIEQAFKE